MRSDTALLIERITGSRPGYDVGIIGPRRGLQIANESMQ